MARRNGAARRVGALVFDSHRYRMGNIGLDWPLIDSSFREVLRAVDVDMSSVPSSIRDSRRVWRAIRVRVAPIKCWLFKMRIAFFMNANWG